MGIFCYWYLLLLLSFAIDIFCYCIFCYWYVLLLVHLVLGFFVVGMLWYCNLLWVSLVMCIFCYWYLLLLISFAIVIFCCLYLLLLVSFAIDIFLYWYLFQRVWKRKRGEVVNFDIKKNSILGDGWKTKMQIFGSLASVIIGNVIVGGLFVVHTKPFSGYWLWFEKCAIFWLLDSWMLALRIRLFLNCFLLAKWLYIDNV